MMPTNGRLFPPAIICLATVLAMPAQATPLNCQRPVVGINLAGAEFAASRLPGVFGRDYKFPLASQIRYYHEIGFNAIRLPVLWERLQPELGKPLDADYLRGLTNTLDMANQAGMRVVVDLHNYARYRSSLIGTSEVTSTAYQDLWSRLATALRGHDGLGAYGIMNEPYNTQGGWEAWAQAAVDAIRQVDRETRIYVAGDAFSNAQRWPITHPKPFVNDPSGNFAYEAHLYFDKDGSGKYNQEVPEPEQEAAIRRKATPFISWLARYGKQGVIGEWGVPTSSLDWMSSVQEFLKVANQACLDTYMWAGGSWSPGYKLSLQPDPSGDKPLVTGLREFLSKFLSTEGVTLR